MSKSSTTTENGNAAGFEDMESAAVLSPIHPGEILREEFLGPLGLSAGQVARACLVPRTRIERIMREELGVSADTALRLGKLFGTSAEFWLNLQKRYEMEIARDLAGEDIKRIAPLQRAA